MVFAEGVLVPEYMGAGEERYRLIADRVGSMRLVVRVSDGGVVQRLDFPAFGEVVTDTGRIRKDSERRRFVPCMRVP